jgi:membrane protease YdiL (CAAX protease family)
MTEQSIQPSASAPPAPWSVLGTILWAAAGICVWFAVQLAVVVAVMMWRDVGPDSADASQLGSDGFLLAFVTIVAGPAWIGVSVIAARWRGWRARDYLALVAPKRGEIAFSVGCMVMLLVVLDLLSLALGRSIVPGFMIEAYNAARASGTLVLFFLAVVVVAPITEEIAFRGFLFRGLSASWLGLGGTLVVTSVAWAAMHVQYDFYLLGQIFLIGLLLGWLRWASGSTLLTIGLHMLANLAACAQAVILVEWMS